MVVNEASGWWVICQLFQWKGLTGNLTIYISELSIQTVVKSLWVLWQENQ